MGSDEGFIAHIGQASWKNEIEEIEVNLDIN